MQFEEIDKKMREAADNHHPTYDEKAWVKMEKLLDKHMPVEEDRRRIMFLVILLFLGLGGAGLLILKPWKSREQVAVEKKLPLVSTEPKTEAVPVIVPVPEPTQTKEPTTIFALKPMQTSIAKLDKTPSRVSKNFTKNDPIQGKPIVEQKTSDPILSNKNQVREDTLSLKSNSKAEPNKIAEPLPAIEQMPSQSPGIASQIKKPKGRKQHAVFVSFSGGPDRSFVGANAGTVKLFGGAGIGYTYNNRISLRTGFYSGKKIYSAGANDYSPPPGFYAYYPYLEKVDANCEIYEVPISLSYHFGKSSRQNFFASVGVSSYFLKEEKYTYYYKYSQNGPTLNKTRTIKDINKHSLAGLTLSAGYSKKITRHISLSAEPYVKIPLEGVGYGKVMLNSSGVSMSLSVNPFAKKRN